MQRERGDQRGAGREWQTARRPRQVFVVFVALGQGVEEFCDVEHDLLAVAIGKRIGAGQSRIFAARFIPAGPDVVDVAVMDPEDRIVPRPWHAAHALAVADVVVDDAVRIVVEVGAESGAAAVHVEFHGAQIERGRARDLVDRRAGIDLSDAVLPVERPPGRIALLAEFPRQRALAGLRVIPVRNGEGVLLGDLPDDLFQAEHEHAMPRQEHIAAERRIVRLAGAPCVLRQLFVRAGGRTVDAGDFVGFGAVVAHGVGVPLEQPAARIALRQLHHELEAFGVDLDVLLPVGRGQVVADARGRIGAPRVEQKRRDQAAERGSAEQCTPGQSAHDFPLGCVFCLFTILV